MQTQSNFHSGCADVLHVDAATQTVLIQPERHARRGYEAWWYVKLSGLRPGEPVHVRVTGGTTKKDKNWAWILRASFSEDQERWHLTDPGEIGADNGIGYIQYTQVVQGGEAWFAYALPYLPAHARSLFEHAERSGPHVQRFELCRTHDDRDVPVLRVSAGTGNETRFGVWLMARCHAWESGTSWVLHGLTEWLLSDDPEAIYLRHHAETTLVPIVDVDSVVIGHSGKGQMPRDHARDWDDSPYWPSVAAGMREIRRLCTEDRFDLLIDIHGPGGNAPYFIVPSLDQLTEVQQRRMRLFLDEFPAVVRRSSNTPTSTEYRYSARENFPVPGMPVYWAYRNTTPHVVAAVLEVSMTTELSHQNGYLLQGETLGRGIARYIRALKGQF